MKTIDLKATFKGQDGSLGYKTGRIYDIKLIMHKDKPQITMTCTGHDDCFYDDFILFLQNWNIN